MAIPKEFNQITRQELNAYAAWLPIANNFRLGDYGVIVGGVFDRLGNLNEDFDIDIGTPVESPPAKGIDFLSSGSKVTRLTADGSVAGTMFPDVSVDAQMEIAFSSAESFLIRCTNVVATEIANVRRIAERMKVHPEWKKKYRVIRRLLTVKEAAVIATKTASTTVTLSGTAKALRQFELAGASAGISLTGSSQLSLDIMGRDGVIALNMVRIGFWGGTQLEAAPRPGDDLIDWGDSWGDDLPDDELDGQAE